jgi:hypothetical protein
MDASVSPQHIITHEFGFPATVAKLMRVAKPAILNKSGRLF